MDLNNPTEKQIIQHNKILLGGQNINLRAKQLIYVLAGLLQREDPLEEIRINSKEFLTFINTTSGEKWSDIYALSNDIFDHLNNNPILIKKDRGKDFKKINWLSSLTVERGELKARFSPDIGYYFAYKKDEPYTKLLWDLRNYKSAHTARLMDLFQKYHRKESGDIEVKFKYEVDELKFFLGVQDKYSKFSDFKRRVLEPVKQELEQNDYVPYWFEYDVLRKGKTAHKIAFTIYVRHDTLINLIPELRLLEPNPNQQQQTIFESAENSKLSEAQTSITKKLLTHGVKRNYAVKVVSNLSDTQSLAYLELIQYGVNRSLAFSLIKDYCSFGELVGYENLYVKHSLEILEKQRLERIRAHRAGETKKKTTPEEKRGGLAKKVFVEKLHFPSFMEKISSIRYAQNRNRQPITRTRPSQNYSPPNNDYPTNEQEEKPSGINHARSLGDILGGMKKDF